jgi:hypothetical protein
MTRNCDVCRKPYEAARVSSKFCSDSCRKRARRGVAIAPAVPVAPLVPPVSLVGTLTAATTAELQAAGREFTSLGQAALLLARRLESGEVETGSSVAALVREHRAVLAQAVDGAEVAADPLDELADRRFARRANG